jgi:dTMP kinase
VFIVLEGLDGCGTTTQCARLGDALTRRGGEVVLTHEPTDRPIGRLIRKTLQKGPGAPSVDALPWLFAADRKDHLMHEVEPAISAHQTVISDRYYHSSLAYQSLHLPLEQVHQLNITFRAPDVTFFLDIDVETAMARIEARGGVREIYETRERLLRIRDAYEAVVERLTAKGELIRRVDGRLPIEEVTESLLAQL